MGLLHRGVQLPGVACPRCGLKDEDPSHIFVSCLWAKCIWWNIFTCMRVPFPADVHSLVDIIEYISTQPGDESWKKAVYTIALATVSRIWYARNLKAFENIFIPISVTVDSIKEDAFIWISNRSKLKTIKWGNWLLFDFLGSM
ncbi:hypothetical protein Hanom_Chr00s175158g01830231 [Helianthus anomalus]